MLNNYNGKIRAAITKYKKIVANNCGQNQVSTNYLPIHFRLKSIDII